MENESTVQPVSNEIAGNIAKVKGNVVVGNDKSVQPGEKSPVEGVYAADNKKKKKFFCPKVMLQIVNSLQDKCSFRYRYYNARGILSTKAFSWLLNDAIIIYNK